MTWNLPSTPGPTSPRLGTAMTVAVQEWDRTAPLLNRRVSVYNINFIGVPNRTAWEGLFTGSYSAAELPIARFLFNYDQGDPLIAVPIFLDRLFLQRYIYVRADDPIERLEELRGRKVLVPSYYMTSSFWHRFFLREAGVQPEEVKWVTGGPELDKRMHVPESIDLTIAPGPVRGIELLINGEVDCVMDEYTRVLPKKDAGKMRRLFPNTMEVHADWYRRTRIFPTLHLLVLRREALEQWPDFGVELCQAFDRAKAEMYLWLQSERTTGLPFAREAIDASLELFGDDPWPYGIEKNEAELNQYLDLAFMDGLTKTRLKIEDVFDARSMEYQFQARMKESAQHVLPSDDN